MLELDPDDEVKEKVSHNGISSLVSVLRPEERGTVACADECRVQAKVKPASFGPVASSPRVGDTGRVPE